MKIFSLNILPLSHSCNHCNCKFRLFTLVGKFTPSRPTLAFKYISISSRNEFQHLLFERRRTKKETTKHSWLLSEHNRTHSPPLNHIFSLCLSLFFTNIFSEIHWIGNQRKGRIKGGVRRICESE